MGYRARTQPTHWGSVVGARTRGWSSQAFAQTMSDNRGAVDLEGPLATVPLATIPLATVPLAILCIEIPSPFTSEVMSTSCSFGVFCLRKHTIMKSRGGFILASKYLCDLLITVILACIRKITYQI